MVEAALAGFEHEIHRGTDLEKVSLTEWLITSALGWWFKVHSMYQNDLWPDCPCLSCTVGNRHQIINQFFQPLLLTFICSRAVLWSHSHRPNIQTGSCALQPWICWPLSSATGALRVKGLVQGHTNGDNEGTVYSLCPSLYPAVLWIEPPSGRKLTFLAFQQLYTVYCKCHAKSENFKVGYRYTVLEQKEISL